MMTQNYFYLTLFIIAAVACCIEIVRKREKIKMLDMFTNISIELADIKKRVDSLEDATTSLKDATDGPHNQGYWESVFNYNPYRKKENEQ